MKLGPEQLRRYSSYIDELAEIQVLGKLAPVLVCEYCKLKSTLVLKDVHVPASPDGAGGRNYSLCFECMVEIVESAHASLSNYYSNLL